MKRTLMLFFLLPVKSYSAAIVFGTFTLPNQNITLPTVYKGGEVINFKINLQNATGITTTFSDCSSPNASTTAGYGGYYYHLGLPSKVSVAGRWVDVNVNSGWYNDNNDSNFKYYTSQSIGGQGTNKPCSHNQRSDSSNAPSLDVSIKLPQNMLSGDYRIEIPVVLGLGSNYWDWPENAYNYRLNALKPGGIASAVNTHLSNAVVNINVNGACKAGSNVYEINHGSLSIDTAPDHYASTLVNINCTTPVSATFTLISNTKPEYSVGYPAVGLGNGWDSIMSIDTPGYAYGNYTDKKVWTNTTNNFTLEIGSLLYGEEGRRKPGDLSGSMTLVMTIN